MDSVYCGEQSKDGLCTAVKKERWTLCTAVNKERWTLCAVVNNKK